MESMADRARFITAAPCPSAPRIHFSDNPWESGKEGRKNRTDPLPGGVGLLLGTTAEYTENGCRTQASTSERNDGHLCRALVPGRYVFCIEKVL